MCYELLGKVFNMLIYPSKYHVHPILFLPLYKSHKVMIHVHNSNTHQTQLNKTVILFTKA